MPLHYTNSEMTQHEQDLLNEQELENLKRHYKTMRNEGFWCKKHCDNHIESQVTNYLNRLKSEQLDVDTNLKLAQSSAVTKRDFDNYNEISQLREAQLSFVEEVRNETENCDSMDLTIRELEHEIELQQKKNGGAIRSHASHVGRIKRIRVYENRLNTATVQFNNLLTENTDLRERIEHFRKQRKVFNTLYKRLASKSTHLKDQIDEVILSATAAYNSRDESHSKMVSLSERNALDLRHFVEEEKEMTRIIAKESGLQAFMNTKNSEKSELAYHEALIRHQTHESRAEQQQEHEMVKFERVLSAIIAVLGEDQGKRLMSILHDDNNKEMKSVALTEAIQPVCDRYRKTEEQNFSLFQFVNEISHDVKRLNEEIAKLSTERQAQKAATSKKVSTHTTAVTMLRCNLQDHDSDLKNLELRLRATHENFNGVKGKVDNLFRTLKCDSTKLDSMLDNQKQEVNPQNLSLYLASIENTINNLMESEVNDKVEKGKLDTEEKPVGRPTLTVDPKLVNKDGKKANANQTLNDIATSGGIELVEHLYCDLESGPLDLGTMRDRAKQMMTERIKTNTPRRKTKAKI